MLVIVITTGFGRVKAMWKDKKIIMFRYRYTIVYYE
jgi:hypothetical protein